jgi:hypothetical protein
MAKEKCFSCGICVGPGTPYKKCDFYKYIICDSCLLLVEERGWLRPSIPFETLLLINGETYKGSASKTYGNTDDPAFVRKVNEARVQAYA